MKDALKRELELLCWKKDDSGVLMAVWQKDGSLKSWEGIGGLAAVIAGLRGKRVEYIMVNVVPPGVTVGLHTDPLPRELERWHMPLKTNPGAMFRYEHGGWEHMLEGQWWGPIEFWTPHQVRNLGTEERVHLVVDLV